MRLKKEKYKIGILLLVGIFMGIKHQKEIKENTYCQECPKWSEEYKKLYQEGARIHPYGWTIKIEKKSINYESNRTYRKSKGKSVVFF